MSGFEPDQTPRARGVGRALGACQADVVLARTELEEARRRGDRRAVEPARANLVAALEEYAAAIERAGAPLPRGLQTELQLYRNLGHRS